MRQGGGETGGMSGRIHNRFPELMPGDVILVHGKGWFSRAIIFVERFLPGDSGKRLHRLFRASHEATVVSAGIVAEEVNGMRLAPEREYEHTRVVIYRYKHATTEQRRQVSDRLVEMWGQKYGWVEIVLFLLNAIFHTYWFTHTFRTGLKVCSQAGVWAWQMELKRPLAPGFAWQDMSPERCAVFFRTYPYVHEWERVFESEAP
jgi:hypothetical protein